MNALKNVFLKEIELVSTKYVRYLHDKIEWKSRLIAILGARGVGKSTLVLQHIKLYEDINTTLYVSADNIYFSAHTLLDLANEFYNLGGKALYIDEIHKYNNWSQEIKNIYDSFPDLRIVYTGSSILELEKGGADLYRRKVNKEAHQIKFEKRLLKKGASSECRFKNDAIFNLVQRFATSFHLGIEESPMLGLFADKGVIRYAYVDTTNYNAETYAAWVDKTIKEYGLLRDNCAVIASTNDLLQEIDYAYRNRTGTKTITTFPTHEQHEKMISMSASSFIGHTKSLERTKKLNFSMINEGLKLSTIYSFKGWEADNIILFIQKPEKEHAKNDKEHPKPIELAPPRALCPEIIYTAISRARTNLFIFNLGNEQYNQFFKQYI